MKEDIEKYEIFERYLKNELTEGEKNHFLKKLNNDPLFNFFKK